MVCLLWQVKHSLQSSSSLRANLQTPWLKKSSGKDFPPKWRLSHWRPDEADKFMDSQTRSDDFAPPLPAPRHCGLVTPLDAPQAN
jgi:hypothetical protein